MAASPVRCEPMSTLTLSNRTVTGETRSSLVIAYLAFAALGLIWGSNFIFVFLRETRESSVSEKRSIFERAAVRSTDRTGSSRKSFSKLILVSYLSKGRCPHELRVATKSRSFQRVRTDSQTFSGSAFRANVSVSTEHFKLLAGTPKHHVKTAESGNERLLAFCGNCGTPIYACAPAAPTSYSLRIGTIEQRAAFTPGKQIWRRSALRWHPRQRRNKCSLSVMAGLVHTAVRLIFSL